eukprot:2488631-Pleurochrysis_carterae.AAC.2
MPCLTACTAARSEYGGLRGTFAAPLHLGEDAVGPTLRCWSNSSLAGLRRGLSCAVHCMRAAQLASTYAGWMTGTAEASEGNCCTRGEAPQLEPIVLHMNSGTAMWLCGEGLVRAVCVGERKGAEATAPPVRRGGRHPSMIAMALTAPLAQPW